MNKLNKKGFTLIELLAVIVILAVIALISVPLVMNIIDSAKKGAAESSAYGYINGIETAYATSLIQDKEFPTGTTEVTNETLNKIAIKGKKPTKGTVTIDKDKITSAMLCIDGYKVEYINEKATAVANNCDDMAEPIPPKVVYKEAVLNGTDPVLDSGMIPIKYEENKWVKADIYEKWYDYTNKEWANMVLVTEATREKYQNATPNTEVLEADIQGYFVWIPRYKYELFNASNGSIAEQEIKIAFENNGTSKSNGSTNGTYLTHPAFTFGSKELNGFWFAKFETTNTTTVPQAKPNITSLRNINIKAMFDTAKLLNNTKAYGLTNTFDSHMLKNMEWGAMAYLTQSKYGRCTSGTCSEVTFNSNSSYLTGGGNYKTNTNQSTTNNIYGVYDTNGGAYDSVMGGMFDDETDTNLAIASSGFNQLELNSLGKYVDIYKFNSNYNEHSRGKLGDATKETLKTFGNQTGGWYSDSAYFVSLTTDSWFYRGGNYDNSATSGIFSFERGSGIAYVYRSFRIALS